MFRLFSNNGIYDKFGIKLFGGTYGLKKNKGFSLNLIFFVSLLEFFDISIISAGPFHFYLPGIQCLIALGVFAGLNEEEFT